MYNESGDSMGKVMDEALMFKAKYPKTICFRLKKHAKVVEDYVNPSEKVLYVFCGQKNDRWYDFFTSCVVVLTDKRILIGQKRVTFGSFYTQITPDMYNDLKIFEGLFWGKINIDTVKEHIIISNIQKKALDEIETNVSELMMKAKQKYPDKD